MENDWLDAIVLLSTDQFMNTGIVTYNWICSKGKPARRKGKVQLIDASHCYEPRRNIYGDKNGVYCRSKIFNTEDFGYYKIVVERPKLDEHGKPILKRGKLVADPDRRDTENIPMTRYFYEYQPPEPVEEILSRVTALEADISADFQALFDKEAITMATEIFVEQYDDYEIIGGEKFMAPSPGWGHVNVTANLVTIIGGYARINKFGVAVADNFDVHFPDGNLFKPDFIFVSAEKAKSLFANKNATLHGVPDMVAEIFSRSTMKRDIGIKKDIYERNGVREYWMIDPWRETVEVYLLRGGKYEFGGLYQNWSDDELLRLSEDERAQVEFEIPVDVLDGFKVKIKNIFGWYFES